MHKSTQIYNTNKPCRNGHSAPRRISDHKCIECTKINKLKERSKAGYKEKMKEYQESYYPKYISDPDNAKARKEYRDEHSDKQKAYMKIFNSKEENKIARKIRGWKDQGIKLTEQEEAKYLDLIKGNCDSCGRTAAQSGMKRDLYLDHDHITGRPRAILCHSCNTIEGCLNKMNNTQLELTIMFMKKLRINHASNN